MRVSFVMFIPYWLNSEAIWNFVNAHIITHITHNTHHRHEDMRLRMWMQYESKLKRQSKIKKKQENAKRSSQPNQTNTVHTLNETP